MEYISLKKLIPVGCLIILLALSLNAIFSMKWIVFALWLLPIIIVLENKYAKEVNKRKLSDWQEFWGPVFGLYIALVNALIIIYLRHR